MSLAARIVAVADAFDAMTSLRSYQRAVSLSDARKELAACAGKQFDPQVVRAMLSVSMGQLWPAMGPLSWLAQLPILAGTPPDRCARLGSHVQHNRLPPREDSSTPSRQAPGALIEHPA